MIEIEGGWAQWDYSIGTFRAEVNGVVYGTYTNEIPTVGALETLLSGLGVTLSEVNLADLASQKLID